MSLATKNTRLEKAAHDSGFDLVQTHARRLASVLKLPLSSEGLA